MSMLEKLCEYIIFTENKYSLIQQSSNFQAIHYSESELLYGAILGQVYIEHCVVIIIADNQSCELNMT